MNLTNKGIGCDLIAWTGRGFIGVADWALVRCWIILVMVRMYFNAIVFVRDISVQLF